jgi:hypothetical protein
MERYRSISHGDNITVVNNEYVMNAGALKGYAHISIYVIYLSSDT